MQHACRTLQQMPVVAGPGTMNWTVSRRGICHARLRQLELAEVPRCNARLLPCPTTPILLTGARKMLEKDHDISDRPHSFVYLTPVLSCQMEPEMIFHPWSLRHLSFVIRDFPVMTAHCRDCLPTAWARIYSSPCAFMIGQSSPGTSICP